MKIYLAARFSRLQELNWYAGEAEVAGLTVTSRWLRGDHEWVGTADDDIPADHLARFATEDLEDLDAADVMVCFTEIPRSAPNRGGRHIEAGYAIARRKPVIVVGPIENVFYALPQITRVATWDEALHVLLNTTAGTPQEMSHA